MKKDKRFKEFTVPILNDTYSVYVFIGDRAKANKAMQKYFESDVDFLPEKTRGRCVYKEGLHPCIWVDGTLPWKTATGTLAHEAIHAVSDIMEYLVMDARDVSGNEFLAHSVGAILRTCLPDRPLQRE